MRLCGVPAGERQSIFRDIRDMENEALRVMAEQREST